MTEQLLLAAIFLLSFLGIVGVCILIVFSVMAERIIDILNELARYLNEMSGGL